VRTPAVDVPVATLSGQGPPGAAGPGWLVGSTTPLDDATLQRLYRDKSGYLNAYTASLDAAISDGFLLPADRAELLAQATTFPFPAPFGS
jgi:Alpha/beta hydrolase domain